MDNRVAFYHRLPAPHVLEGRTRASRLAILPGHGTFSIKVHSFSYRFQQERVRCRTLSIARTLYLFFLFAEAFRLAGFLFAGFLLAGFLFAGFLFAGAFRLAGFLFAAILLILIFINDEAVDQASPLAILLSLILYYHKNTVNNYQILHF